MVGQKDGSIEWWKDRVKTVTPLKLYLHEVLYKQYNHNITKTRLLKYTENFIKRYLEYSIGVFTTGAFLYILTKRKLWDLSAFEKKKLTKF